MSNFLKTIAAARGYTVAADVTQLSHVTAVQEHRWNTVKIGGHYPPAGDLLGYCAHAYGPYAPGGNPVLQGPRRATAEEAQADAADPSRVLWRVVGHSI